MSLIINMFETILEQKFKSTPLRFEIYTPPPPPPKILWLFNKKLKKKKSSLARNYWDIIQSNNKVNTKDK